MRLPRRLPQRKSCLLYTSISQIAQSLPPPELALPAEPMTRISIFMNVFDCHVNRAPVPGRIAKIAYTPGLFLNAELDKASDDNERNALAIETKSGIVGVVQIAGLIAFSELLDQPIVIFHVSTAEGAAVIRDCLLYTSRCV